MLRSTALTINITMHAPPPPRCRQVPQAEGSPLLQYHDPGKGKGEEFQVSKVRWTNVGIAQVKNEEDSSYRAGWRGVDEGHVLRG